DAESATLIDGRSDERDQPFLLGVTHVDLPWFRVCFLAILRRFHRSGVEELSGHELYAVSEAEYAAADAWLERTGIAAQIEEAAAEHEKGGALADATLDKVFPGFVDLWQKEAGVSTYGEAVAKVMRFRASEGQELPMSEEAWLAFASRVSVYEAREKARE